MKTRMLAATSAVLLMFSGAVFAQETQSIDRGQHSVPFASDDERMMYEENSTAWGGFFTDDTMTGLRTNEEIRESFATMDRDSQAGIKQACERAVENPGSYGTVTVDLCQQVGEL